MTTLNTVKSILLATTGRKATTNGRHPDAERIFIATSKGSASMAVNVGPTDLADRPCVGASWDIYVKSCRANEARVAAALADAGLVAYSAVSFHRNIDGVPFISNPIGQVMVVS